MLAVAAVPAVTPASSAASGPSPASQQDSSPALKASPAPVESVSCDSGAGTLIRSVGEYQDAPCRPWVTTTAPTTASTGSRPPNAASSASLGNSRSTPDTQDRKRSAPAVATCTAACGSTEVVHPARCASRNASRPAGREP